MKENQHLGLWNNKYVKRLKNKCSKAIKTLSKKGSKGEVGHIEIKMKWKEWY